MQVFGDLQLQPMRDGIIVLLTEEDNIGLGQLTKHLVIVGGRAGGGEEAISRPVAGKCEAGKSQTEQEE